MGAVCTPTTPPRIPILLRFTVKDGGGDDMHVAIPMHVCAAPFLKWGRCTAIVSARCAPTPGGPVPSPRGMKNEKHACHGMVCFFFWVIHVIHMDDRIPHATRMGNHLPMRTLAWANVCTPM